MISGVFLKSAILEADWDGLEDLTKFHIQPQARAD